MYFLKPPPTLSFCCHVSFSPFKPFWHATQRKVKFPVSVNLGSLCWGGRTRCNKHGARTWLGPDVSQVLSSWWFFTNPFEKILVKLETFPNFRGENKTYLKFHHLVILDFFVGQLKHLWNISSKERTTILQSADTCSVLKNCRLRWMD